MGHIRELRVEIRFPIELQQQVEQAIVQRKWAIGQSLMATKLTIEFHASLSEMQTVLRAEHRKGLLAVEDADTFRVLGIAAPQTESVFQHTSKMGFKPSSVMRNVAIAPASVEIAQRLELALGDPVYRLERTRLVDGQVLANQINVIPFQVCPGLEKDNVSHASFQQLIDLKYHAVTTQMQEEFAVVAATRQDEQILDLKPDTKLLAIRRLALSATMRPLIWTDIHVRADRFDYVAALWPSAKPLLEQFIPTNNS